MTRACNLAVAAALAAAGCGPGRADIAGEVTFRGRPVAVGSVTLVGHDGLPRTVTIRDGRYAANVPVGQVRAAVNTIDPLLELQSHREDQTLTPEVEAEIRAKREKWFPVPDAYSDARKSGVAFPVTAGGGSFDIALE